MRHTYLTRVFLLGVLCFSVLPDQPGAQIFLPPNSADNIPLRPGEGLTPGQSVTMYFQGHTATSTLEANSWYDAVGWFNYGSPVTPQDTLPPNWIWGTGGSMVQCEPKGGDAGGTSIRAPLILGPIVQTNWGTAC